MSQKLYIVPIQRNSKFFTLFAHQRESTETIKMSEPLCNTNLDKVLVHAILGIVCPLYPENKCVKTFEDTKSLPKQSPSVKAKGRDSYPSRGLTMPGK